MRFSIALLAASASALELPNTFFTSTATGNYNANQWGADTGSTLGTRFLSSKFNNRFRMLRPNQGGDTLTSNINDARGYDRATDLLVTGEDQRGMNSKFTESGMDWFGGCYFKPARQFEEYYNDLLAAGRYHQYTNPTDAFPTVMPDFQNRKVTGSVAYHCEDADPTNVATTTVNCEFTAKARSYKWDVTNARQNINLKVWRPFMEVDTILGGEIGAGNTITATAVTKNLDDNCLRQFGKDSTSTDAYAGRYDQLTRNQYHYAIPVANAADEYTYAQSNFISRLHQFDTATNIDGSVATSRNLRYTEAWAVLDIDTSNQNGAVTGGFNYAVVNSRAAGGSAVQTAVTHAAEKLAVDNDANLTYPDALSTLNDQPPLACCKFEEWNKRTFMRMTETISREFYRKCHANATYNWGAGTTAYTPVTGMLTCIADSDGATTALLT